MSQAKFESLQKLPTRELKEMCRDAKLKVSGNKGQLLMRLCGMEKEKPKSRTRSMSVKAVNNWLEKQGITDVESVSKCLRAGIQKGHIDISGESPLDNVIIEGGCLVCDGELKATIRDLLYQPDYAGLDYEEGGENATLKCPSEDCGGVYVTRMCNNGAQLDSGKFHNHCTECPGFGKCIGDYREAHCGSCGKHYFAGLSGFSCRCQGRGSDERDDCVIQ